MTLYLSIVGNIDAYLPLITGPLQEANFSGTGASTSLHYHLLGALRELISFYVQHAENITPPPGLANHLADLVLTHCDCEDEGIRNMVSECLGKLAVLEPSSLVPVLQSHVDASSSAYTRATVVTALKFCVASSGAAELLQGQMSTFLSLLSDDDLHVKRAALITITSVVHHQSSIIRRLITNQKLAEIYQETVVRPELQRKVDLGPFKVTVDDGLPVRKAAYSCLDTILDTLPERFDFLPFVPYLANGLEDQDDIQIMCHVLLGKLTHIMPGPVLAALDDLVDPLAKALTKLPKETQAAPEKERANDLLRSTLRCIESISRIPDVLTNRKFSDLMINIERSEKLFEMLKIIQQDSISFEF